MDNFHREIKTIIEKSDLSRVKKEVESCLYLLEVKKYTAAAGRIREILKNTSRPAVFNLLLAVTYRSMGEIGDALKAIEKAIELDPQNPFYAGWKAMILLSGSNVKEAREWAEIVLRQAPDQGFAHYVCGKVLMMEKKWDEAEAHLRKAFDDLQNIEPIGLFLAQTFLKQKKHEEARDLLIRMSREEPANEPIQGLLFFAEEGLDHFDEAIKLGEHVLKSKPHPIVNCLLKKVKFKKQLTEEMAAESFEPCGKDTLRVMLTQYFSAGRDFILSRISREELDSLSSRLTADRMLSLLVHINQYSYIDFQFRHAWREASVDNLDRVVMDKAACLGFGTESCSCVARYRKASSLVSEAVTYFDIGDFEPGLGCLLKAALADYTCRGIYRLFRTWVNNLETLDNWK